MYDGVLIASFLPQDEINASTILCLWLFDIPFQLVTTERERDWLPDCSLPKNCREGVICEVILNDFGF
jgi:hypothetical protein